MAALEAEAQQAAEEERRNRAEKDSSAKPKAAKEAGQTAAPPSEAPIPRRSAIHRSGKPHHEVEGWLRSGL